MRPGFAFILAAAMLAGTVPASATGKATAPACDLPPALLTPALALPHTTAALARKRLSVLAIGSGSTVGQGAGTPASAGHLARSGYPDRLQTALRALRPDAQISLTVDGARDITAADMLPLLRAALAGRHFDLVLWQTGTVEAMRGAPPDQLAAALRNGAAAVSSASADLVLIDPQFSRFLRTNADLMPYEAALRGVAAARGVPLFPRYDLTRLWAESGRLDLERVRRDARPQAMALLNGCLGEALARFIVSAAHG